MSEIEESEKGNNTEKWAIYANLSQYVIIMTTFELYFYLLMH